MASFKILFVAALAVAAVMAEDSAPAERPKKQIYSGYYGSGYGAYPYSVVSARSYSGAYPAHSAYSGAYPAYSAGAYPAASVYSSAAYPAYSAYSAGAYPAYSSAAYPAAYSAGAYPYSAAYGYSAYPAAAAAPAKAYY